jgi:hypothetical protein
MTELGISMLRLIINGIAAQMNRMESMLVPPGIWKL